MDKNEQGEVFEVLMTAVRRIENAKSSIRNMCGHYIDSRAAAIMTDEMIERFEAAFTEYQTAKAQLLSLAKPIKIEESK